MAIHKLVFDDLECDSYQLIAIHCSLEDYRLAYLLNSHLNLRLKRKQNDLDFSVAAYSIFEWEDQNHMRTWNLISNICKVEKNQQEQDTSSLFQDRNSIQVYNLVPEYKEANYFLKIDCESNASKEKRMVNSILSIPQIVTAYSIDTENLKSKTNLIFD